MSARSLSTIVAILLLSSASSIAAPSATISLAKGTRIAVPDDWKAIHDTRSTYTLEHRTSRNVLDASMVIQIQAYASHEQAMQHLSLLSAGTSKVSTFRLTAGWPALERRVVAPFQRPGEDQDQTLLHGPEKSVQLLAAVAVDRNLIVFQTLLQPDADPKLADEALAIIHGLTAPKADLRQSNKELRVLRGESAWSSPLIPRAYAPVRRPSPTGFTPQPPGVPEGGAGAMQVGGSGEIEAAASISGKTFVTDAACSISHSGNSGVSFTASNVNGSGAPAGLDGDCSVAWGPSGNFYLSQLGSGFVALYRSTAPDGGANFNYLTLAVDRRSTSTFPTNVDQPHIVTDRFNSSASGKDLVYVVWQETSNFVSRLACSSDSGSTWSAPVDAESGNLGYPRAAVGKDGMVYVVSRMWGLPALLPAFIVLDKFSNCDQGLVEQPGFPVIRPFNDAYGSDCDGGSVAGLDRCNDGNTLASPTVAGDDTNANHMYMAWADMNAGNGQDILVTDSYDGGLTWNAPVAANSNVTAVRFMPWLAVWSGTAYLGWYDRRSVFNPSASDDFTRYYRGSVASVNGVLTPEPEFDLMGTDDPQCASGWPDGTREPQDATNCTVQPQFAGFCSRTHAVCDFASATPCQGGQTCKTALGAPKYGDYNGLATGGGLLLNIWASGTAPNNLPRASSNSILSYAVITALSPPLQEAVLCSVFDDGYTNMQGPSDAVYINNNNGQPQACIPNGTPKGNCRKWFGRCSTVTTGDGVDFYVFGDGYTNMQGPSDAVYIHDNNGQMQACIPSSSPGPGICNKWFGRGTVTGGRSASCVIFGDGYANESVLSDAVFENSGNQACIPNGTAAGTCRKWWGRCQAH
jgi:hypothetical protein